MPSPEDPVAADAGAWYLRPWPAGIAVACVYAALSFLLAPGGSLGTDTGAKVATMAVMEQRGVWADLDVGYWAARWDPEGALHPLYQSRPIDGAWIAVTTVTMLLPGRVLYGLGGVQLALALPMAGALAAAFGCRALAMRLTGRLDGRPDGRLDRRLGAHDRAGWVAFWLVALASPMAVYALDFWEHAPGAALMVWAGVHALDATRAPGARAVAASSGVAGLLLGAAATMRTESLVVGFVAVGAACLALLVATRGLLRPLLAGTSALVGFALTFGAGGLLERWMGVQERTARAEGLVGGGGASRWAELPDRLEEGLTTTLSPLASARPGAWAAGAVFVAAVLATATLWRRRETLGLAGALAAGGVLLVAHAGGIGFVPGAWVAFPAAGAGLLALGAKGATRWVAVAALVMYPLTWAFQFLGGALPQWGGRYVLAATLVLGTCAVVHLTRPERDQRGLVALGALCLVVTAVGVSWLVHRTHEIDRVFDVLVDRPEDVVAAENGFFIREGMDAYLQRLWLAASPGAGLQEVAEVVEAAGLGSFAWVSEARRAPAVAGFDLRDTTRTWLLGAELYLHSYRRVGT